MVSFIKVTLKHFLCLLHESEFWEDRQRACFFLCYIEDWLDAEHLKGTQEVFSETVMNTSLNQCYRYCRALVGFPVVESNFQASGEWTSEL